MFPAFETEQHLTLRRNVSTLRLTTFTPPAAIVTYGIFTGQIRKCEKHRKQHQEEDTDMKTTLSALMIFGSMIFSVHAFADAFRLVADFDTEPPNNVNGSFGTFSKSETEQVYVCNGNLDEGVRHGDSGSSLRLNYNVGKGGTYNGFWLKLGPEDVGNNFDASGYSKLTFWLKGDRGVGIPAKLKVEMKGDPGTPLAKKYIGEITDKWKKVEIPLAAFVRDGNIDLAKLNEIVVVIEHNQVGPSTAGVVYIDDLAFEK